MKICRFGDPHCKIPNMEESHRLLRFVWQTCIDNEVDRLEIEGDLFDTMSVVRLEVLNFWQGWLETLSRETFQTIVLVGNHDISGDYGSNYSALSVFRHLEGDQPDWKKTLRIISEPTVDGVFGYMPYIHDNNEFVKQANLLAEMGARSLVSHTTYKGSKYDNGMYAPDGIDPDLLDPRLINLISGHVHTEQKFGRVIYPGTARWLTASDANKRKGIWIYEHDDTGAITSEEFISTESVCTPIISYELKEGGELPTFPKNAKVNVELIGSSDWIQKTKLELKGTCSITTKITDTKKSKARKSGKSLLEFLTHHYQTDKRDRLIAYMREKNLV